MRFFFDTEFIEDGRTIDLISIGIVAEDAREYYAEAAECDLTQASPWVRENVVPHLTGVTTPRAQIAAELIAFVGAEPKFWANYASYDWVVLCQLFGTMMALPKGWPMWCRDLQQAVDGRTTLSLPLQQGDLHHALADARWLKAAWESLK